MVSQGNIAGASRLAQTPGVLKPSAAGSQIKHLGRGSEGLATMVAHPQHGVAARKLYDPGGISTPAMIARKEEAGKAMGSNPNFAQFLGSAQTPHGGGTMHFNEYVPGASRTMKDSTPAQRSAAAQTGRDARSALAEKGYEGHDIRMGNMVEDSRTGQNKLIDYLPARPGEMTSSPAQPNVISPTPSGSHLFQQQQGQATNGQLLGGMLGGKQMPRPGATPSSAAGTSVMGQASQSTSVLGAPSASQSTSVLAQQPGTSARPVSRPKPVAPQTQVGSASPVEPLRPAGPRRPMAPDISRTAIGVPRAPQ